MLQLARLRKSPGLLFLFFVFWLGGGLLTNGSKDSPLDGQHWSVTVGCQCTQRVARPPALCPFLRFLSLSLSETRLSSRPRPSRARARALCSSLQRTCSHAADLSLFLSLLSGTSARILTPGCTTNLCTHCQLVLLCDSNCFLAFSSSQFWFLFFLPSQ